MSLEVSAGNCFVYVCDVCECPAAHVEVRGQLSDAGSLLLSMVSEGRTQLKSPGSHGEGLCPPPHLYFQNNVNNNLLTSEISLTISEFMDLPSSFKIKYVIKCN